MDEAKLLDEARALSIVSALANGVNPVTGEVFDADSPYQAPEIVSALCLASRALESTARRANVGKQWTEEEDQRLLAQFDRGRPITELMQAHGRTLAGIEARLEKHGRLAPQERRTTNRYRQGQNGGDHAP
jgi:hypothetical protein